MAINRSVAGPVAIDSFPRREVAGVEQVAVTAPSKPKIAVFVTHGMGQQVRFQTLDDLTQGLAEEAGRRVRTPPLIRARTVQIGDTELQRAEFDMVDAAGRAVEVHVYEGYWAPITEGQVTIRDVMSFLIRGGINGLFRNAYRDFKRWVFGRVVTFKKNHITAQLLLAFGAVFSLVVMNTLVGIVVAARFVQSAGAVEAPGKWPDLSLMAAVTDVVGVFIAISILFGLSLLVVTLSKRAVKVPGRNLGWRLINAILQAFFYGWLVVTLLAGVLLLVFIFLNHFWPGPFQTCVSSLPIFPQWSWVFIWGSLFVIFLVVRKLLIQYMGDVAAYVSSHTLDRFMEIRTEIRKTLLEVARAIYSAKSDSGHEYERIGLVGHSLGSVVVYDTLNSLMNEDELNGERLNVAGRTRVLLTFGSPLDKTAFVFALRWTRTTETREALAASTQPLIQDYAKYRKLKWINVYSPRDVIGSSVDFYDDKCHPTYMPEMEVQNVIDPDALIPLVAHTEHWKNRTIFKELYDALS